MTGTDLIGVAERLGPLALWLVLLAGLLWLLADKVLGKEGFLTRMANGVFNRELTRARRAAEREALARQAHDARRADLLEQAAYLENELREARAELAAVREQLRQALADLSSALNELAVIRRDVSAVRTTVTEEAP